MDENIVDWKVFLALWKHRNVTEAAQELRLHPADVSRRLQKLELKLGCKLFDRTVRPFVPTESAKDIVDRAREMLSQREMMLRYFQEKQDATNIVIRLMMGNSFRAFGAKALKQYLEMVPGQRINVISPIDVDEFLIGKADLLDATGPIKGHDLVMIPRGLVLYVPVATPEYIEKHGPINHPSGLVQHCIFSNHFKNRYSFRNPHMLKKGKELSSFDYIESVRYSNVEMALQATLEGAGIGLSMPHYLCIDELEKGTLVPILDGWHRPCVENYMIAKKDTWKLKPVRTFGTWLAKRQLEFLKDCEKRLIRLYGNRFVDNLKT